MRSFFGIGISILALSVFFSCGRGKLHPESGVIARVGDKVLSEADIKLPAVPGITARDSLKLLDSYVDIWVKNQLKAQEAEKLFGADNDDIDKMVEDYRSSLLGHKLERYYLSLKPDTVFGSDSVEAYYNAHTGDYKLDRDIVKGVLVKLPAAFRQKDDLKKLMSESGDKYQDFLDISSKNGFQVTEYPVWTDFSDISALLPVDKGPDTGALLEVGRVSEIKDGNDLWYLFIREKRGPGDASPLERVEESIRRVLENQQRQALIRSYEDSLFRAANQAGEVEIRSR